MNRIVIARKLTNLAIINKATVQ